jgi:hypothetical protein
MVINSPRERHKPKKYCTQRGRGEYQINIHQLAIEIVYEI